MARPTWNFFRQGGGGGWKYILGTTVLAKNFQICKIEEVFTDDAWKSVGKLGKDGSCTLQKTRFMLYPFFLKFKWYKYLV